MPSLTSTTQEIVWVIFFISLTTITCFLKKLYNHFHCYNNNFSSKIIACSNSPKGNLILLHRDLRDISLQYLNLFSGAIMPPLSSQYWIVSFSLKPSLKLSHCGLSSWSYSSTSLNCFSFFTITFILLVVTSFNQFYLLTCTLFCCIWLLLCNLSYYPKCTILTFLFLLSELLERFSSMFYIHKEPIHLLNNC